MPSKKDSMEISAPTGVRRGVGDAKRPGETENLTDMENLTEESMLMELLMRYKKDIIYTYVGDIVCAINPFKRIDGIYDDSMQRKYTNLLDKASQAPHLFATADNAFTSMRENKGNAANQVCVISGESGAGKTESAKLFMKHVIYLSGRNNGETGELAQGELGLEDKIVGLNPLLESYGNAQTLMNDNSSRFGKFVELRFNEKLSISGAIMTEYLLEKSRIIEQTSGERNFHVFYLFYCGMENLERKNDFGLGDAAEHRIIEQNEEAIESIETSQTLEQWREFQDCFGAVGFTDDERDQLFHIIAAVLHIGDCEFAGEDEAYITTGDDGVGKMADQLGVEMEPLKQALVTLTSVTRGESIVRNYKEFEACDCRDAMAKALYGRCFSWIVKHCNKLLGPKQKSGNEKTIGILDIFGFEVFEKNSFEQLLINLANEQLQFFFNNHIFALELEEYAREGIDGSTINYESNQALLDMLMKPMGLLALCDEEAKIPRGDDESMVTKFHTHLDKNEKYHKPKGSSVLNFTIDHYAGSVLYDCNGFLEKNRDTLALDLISTLRLSSYPLISDLFGGHPDGPMSKTKGKGGRMDKKMMKKSMKRTKQDVDKTKKTTVGTEFKQSLALLMEEMERAQPHFVRCLKPNLEKKPALFKLDEITKQLRYTGMLETTRIRKEGYSHRPTFADFIARYQIIGFPLCASVPPNSASARKICEFAKITDYQVGKSKVFLRYFHMGLLGDCLKPYPTAAGCIQAAARGFVARAKVARKKAKAEAEAKSVMGFIQRAEREGEAVIGVIEALCEDDNLRPADYWAKKKAAGLSRNPTVKKMQKQAAKKGGINRNQSVKWFKEVEMKKGAGQSEEGGGFESWFHGIISRVDAEKLLKKMTPGAYLVRVAETRFGYSLSHFVAEGKIKHYMIDQTPEGEYIVVGNKRTFDSLNELVRHHTVHKIVATDDVALEVPCGQEGTNNESVTAMGL